MILSKSTFDEYKPLVLVIAELHNLYLIGSLLSGCCMIKDLFSPLQCILEAGMHLLVSHHCLFLLFVEFPLLHWIVIKLK